MISLVPENDSNPIQDPNITKDSSIHEENESTNEKLDSILLNSRSESETSAKTLNVVQDHKNDIENDIPSNTNQEDPQKVQTEDNCIPIISVNVDSDIRSNNESQTSCDSSFPDSKTIVTIENSTQKNFSKSDNTTTNSDSHEIDTPTSNIENNDNKVSTQTLPLETTINDRDQSLLTTTQPLEKNKRASVYKSLAIGSPNIENGTRISFIDESEEMDWVFWNDFVESYGKKEYKSNEELKKKVRKGIPKSIRGIVWLLLSGTVVDQHLINKYTYYSNKKNNSFSKLYSELLELSKTCKFFSDKESDILNSENEPHNQPINSEDESDSHGDTFIENHLMFKSIVRVLNAFSSYDKVTGYNKFQAFICHSLLRYLPEEEVFGILVQLMDTYNLRRYFSSNMEPLQCWFFQLDSIIEELLPSLIKHFDQEGIRPVMYAMQWVMTMFSHQLNEEHHDWLMGVALLEGTDIYFLVILAILKQNEEKLLQLNEKELLQYLTNSSKYESAGNVFDYHNSRSLEHFIKDISEFDFVANNRLGLLKAIFDDLKTKGLGKSGGEKKSVLTELQLQNKNLKNANSELIDSLISLTTLQTNLSNMYISMNNNLDLSKRNLKKLEERKKDLTIKINRFDYTLDLKPTIEDINSVKQRNLEREKEIDHMVKKIEYLSKGLSRANDLLLESENKKLVLQSKIDHFIQKMQSF
ncbi:hypothetical protein BB559_003350 [Furculomyces boomerangus]|uniref:Rab-GAP TBC domain-containing protein n=1 Tax=Furculomyces boomerangus TaxID=61424 RepID=A0A2T9YLT0_9FUNG|nr:hypothetical protein BB559_003350 [Furculomyces boomerangus]